MEDIQNEIIKALEASLSEKSNYAQFNNHNYKPAQLSKDNFYNIGNVKTTKRIAFIDGGNSEILNAANFSLQIIRIYHTIYQKNARINSKKYEFYLLINASNKEGNILYNTKVFPINYDFPDMVFNSFDDTIKQGNNRIKAGKIGEIIRKLAEIKVAETLVCELSDGDVIVRDGDLKACATYEQQYYESLYKKAAAKKVIIAGLSKTSELFTDKGNSLLVTLNEMSPESSWYYYPLVEINSDKHQSEIYIIKLNKHSNYLFKFEIYKNSKYDIMQVMSLLQKNSVDPVFLGYPYGLVEADKFARISNNEAETLKIQFIAKAGKKWNVLKQYLNTTNAHTILDKIS
ncbi:MAG: DNA double-strand break repair nuclease NurA [Nanoarchaeota archaeon]